MKVSIVIQAYNEEKRIGESLGKIIEYCKDNLEGYEIIIVDDGSDDKTSEIISKYDNPNIEVLKNKTNMGKGYSVKQGLLKAKHPLVLFSDADLSTPISELKKFIACISHGYDIAIASRKVRIKQPIHRKIMSLTYPLLVKLIVLRGIKDTICGFKLFKTDTAKKLAELQTLNGFSFDAEILFIAKKLGCKIKEIPVVWTNDKNSRVNPIKDSIKVLVDLFRIRYNNITGKYTLT
jgi:dolichyl-phosphate beta-glucosyltransferase